MRPQLALRVEQLRADAALAEPVAVADREPAPGVVADRPRRQLGGLEPQTVEDVDAKHPSGALERKDGKWLCIREEPRVRAPPLAGQPQCPPDRFVGRQRLQLGAIPTEGAHQVGLSVLEPAPTPTGTLVSPPLWRPAPKRRFTSMLAATPIRPSSVLRLPFSPRARTQIGLFLLAYLVYSAARFVTIGDLSSAKDNAHWIVNLQNSLHIGVESSVQGALDTLLAGLDLQPPVPDRPARRDPGGPDLPVVPQPGDLPDAAQHDPRDVAAVGAGLRPVPGRSRRGWPTSGSWTRSARTR